MAVCSGLVCTVQSGGRVTVTEAPPGHAELCRLVLRCRCREHRGEASCPQPHSGHSLAVAVASSFFLTWDNFHQEILKTGDSWLQS